MKKNITIILAAFVLGLLCSNLVSAQINGLDRPFSPQLIKRIQLPAQAQSQPTINPGMVDRALNAPQYGQRDILGKVQLGPVSQDRLNLPPGFEMQPIGPPQISIPKPFPLPQPLQPTPPPQPTPPHHPQGPTLNFGPGGPSVSFGSGPHINIPIGQIGQRIRERRGHHSPPQVIGRPRRHR